MGNGEDEARFIELKRALQDLNRQLADFKGWCAAQMNGREAKIVRLERANVSAQAELARLRTIISSVGVIAQQAQPSPDDEPDEDDLGE